MKTYTLSKGAKYPYGADMTEHPKGAWVKLGEAERVIAQLCDITNYFGGDCVNQKLLGVTRTYGSIRELRPGMLATACVVICGACKKHIRHNGGPARDAKCLTCFKQEMVTLCGGDVPVSVQCVYTCRVEDEAIEMCGIDDADMISVYLRLENGEVVPVRDFFDDRGLEYAAERARDLVQILEEIFGIKCEDSDVYGVQL